MFNSAFTSAKNTSGSGDTSTPAKSLTARQHVLVTVWNFNTTPVSGSVVYLKDGGAEVSLGEPLQSVDRTGTSDAIASYFLRDVEAGSYVLRAKNLPYVHISGIVIDAQPNCWVRVGANSEGTGTTFTSAAVVPYWGESIAIGYCTHNADGASPNSLVEDTGWTLVHKQEDYDGDSQPGLLQYLDNISGTSSVTVSTTSAFSAPWCQLIVVVSDPPDVYMLTGGTTGEGWFGSEGHGGADSTGSVLFPFGGIPADQAIAMGLSLYDYDPPDASLTTITGSGNSLVKTAGVTHGTGNDNSYTWFHTPTPLTSVCTEVGWDGTSLPAGDAGRYGQIVALVMRYPDTVNGIYTATAVTNAQTAATAINAGTFTLPTDFCVEVVGIVVRGHANDNAPVVTTPDEFEVHMRHSQWTVAVQPPAGYSCWQNSIIASGAAGAIVNEAGGTSSRTVTLLTAQDARSVHTGYNLMGGNPPGGGGGTLLPIAVQHYG